MSVAPLVRANSRMQFERQRNATVLTLSGNDSDVYFPSILSTSYTTEVNPGYMTDVYSSGTVDSACRRAAILSCVKSGKPQLQPLADGGDGPLAPIADVFTPIFNTSYGTCCRVRPQRRRNVRHNRGCASLLSGSFPTFGSHVALAGGLSPPTHPVCNMSPPPFVACSCSKYSSIAQRF